MIFKQMVVLIIGLLFLILPGCAHVQDRVDFSLEENILDINEEVLKYQADFRKIQKKIGDTEKIDKNINSIEIVRMLLENILEMHEMIDQVCK